MRIKKAVIGVAGFGTRFLPASKVMPKELMPIVNKPAVQYLVEEAVSSGIEDVILVTRRGDRAIKDHFSPAPDLERQLEEKGDAEQLEQVKRLSTMARIHCVEQGPELPYGNGSPILAAERLIGDDEAFVYMFGDDMVLGEHPCVKQLVDLFEKHGPGAVVGVQNVPRSETCRYGIVKLKDKSEPWEMESIVEKPEADQAPSTLAQFGRFVLSRRVIDILHHLPTGRGNELWLADAIDQLSRESRVLVCEVEGTWYTIGDPLRFLIANVEYSLRHPGIGKEFRDYLRNLEIPAD